MRIGARLRHAREAGRLSLADVEARTGLTKGFLSKVERDASSPSVANLVAICDAIGLPMADLFAVPRTTLIRHADRPSLEGLPKASAVRDTLITPETERHVTVLETVVANGGSGGDALYTMPSECEVCFVLEGDIEVELEDGTYALGPGDALTFGAAVPHTWRTSRPGPDPVDPRARAPRPPKRGHMKFSPPEASVAPRYTGIRTFARAPHVESPEGVDAAIVGVPFDTATSMRPGARFGPAGIRDASLLLRPYNPAQAVDVFDALSLADLGDLHTTPGNAERTTAQIAEQLEPVLRAGATPITLGGDHSIVLGELRAHAAVHGPVAVVLLDAHADTWEQYYGERYFHGTPFKRAWEEGLIDPQRSLLAGMRGSLYAASDLDEPRGWGFEIVPCDELRTWSAEQYASRVRERVGDGPAFLSFDIDCIDPAFAPATGTPEVCGLLPHEAIAFLRALRGMTFTRLRPRRGRAGLRHQRPDDRAAGGQPRLRVPHPDSTESCVRARSAARRSRSTSPTMNRHSETHGRSWKCSSHARSYSTERSRISASGPIGKRAHQAASKPRASAASISGSQAWTQSCTLMPSSISVKAIRPSASSASTSRPAAISAARSQSARPAIERCTSQPLRLAPSA